VDSPRELLIEAPKAAVLNNAFSVAATAGEPMRIVDLEELRDGSEVDLRRDSALLSDRRVAISNESGSAVIVDQDGIRTEYRKGVILMRWKGDLAVSGIRVRPGSELAGQRVLAARGDVDFAELDVFARRQSIELNDPLATNQTHHAVIGTTNAWRVSAGSHAVRIAIVDDPFQMDHIDLAANAASGWNVDKQVAVTSSAGIKHSTLAAGIAAAVGGNNVGVAGVSQCLVLPVSGTNYTTSMFYNAILWAADHGVRVVSMSWNVAGSATINAGGEYLRQKNEGVLFVAGDNTRKMFSYPNHPYIVAVAMTDDTDAAISGYGDWVDLSAPGWNIYATTINGDYDSDTGTSFATPMVAGVAACLMSINPALTGEQIVNLLQTTAVDLGAPGKDAFYGWGRLDFAKAARAAFATLPVSHLTQMGANIFTVPEAAGVTISLWRSFEAQGPWSSIDSLRTTNAGVIRFEDRTQFERAFYRAQVILP